MSRHAHVHVQSPDSIRLGYPVISISLGDAADFVYGHERVPEEQQTKGTFDGYASGEGMWLGMDVMSCHVARASYVVPCHVVWSPVSHIMLNCGVT